MRGGRSTFSPATSCRRLKSFKVPRRFCRTAIARFCAIIGAVKATTRAFLVIGIAAILIGGGALALTLVERSTTSSITDGTASGAKIGGPFVLVNGDGQTVTDQTFRGKWMLVYFGYTFCPDVCPTTLNNFAQALVSLRGDAKDLAPIFITVDPQRDTAKVVGAYVKAFDPRFVGLTGSQTQVAAVAQEYHVYYAKQPGSGDGNDYLIDHSSFIYLMSQQGKFVKVMPGSLSGGEIADTVRPFIDFEFLMPQPVDPRRKRANLKVLALVGVILGTMTVLVSYSENTLSPVLRRDRL